ncbi:unnamed protein product [Echinostoma caproni]|uniref:U3 small nucleolar RNA-associated protein 23 n=1 Tax=Echinostoma caproni TaxID=27848 RepID=A0A183AH76_9TREM|nr:unnamed protein product [Echinostoma caproni]
MKIKRLKGYKRILEAYSRHFGLPVDPLEVFVDSTFANQALLNKLNITDQLEATFKLPIKLVTSTCTISECESLRPLFSGALSILQQFKVLKCKHSFDPTRGAPWCIRRRIQTARKSGLRKCGRSLLFALASNDELLQMRARLVAGMPIFYVAHNRINMEPVPPTTEKLLDTKSRESIGLSVHESVVVSSLAAQYGVTSEGVLVKKRKRKTGPNPLSCKKKKRNQQPTPPKKTLEKPHRRRRRRRIHNTWAFQQALLHFKEQIALQTRAV